MRVQQIITRLQRRTSKYTRPELLDYLDEVVELVYSSNCRQLKVDYSNDGMPPYLATQAGIFTYDCPADCRRTIAVFTGRTNAYTTEYLFRDSLWANVNVSSRDATETQAATVTFRRDPGTTTSKYYHLYYIQHTPLDSEDIELSIPPGKVHTKIRRGVLALARSEKFGDDDAWKEWERRDLNDIRYELNLGARSEIRGTIDQIETRNFRSRTTSYGRSR